MSHLFSRREEKYVLPTETADQIKKIAERRLSYSEFNRKGAMTDIRTTYLENDEYLIYHMKTSRKRRRVKIRIREYGRKGKFETLVWIELKEKVDGQGFKSRFRLDRKNVKAFLDGEDVFSSVVKHNKGIDSDYLRLLYDRMQKLIRKKRLYPRLVVQYQRIAFLANGECGLRLTFDHNLQSMLLERGDELFKDMVECKCYDTSRVITELKYGNTYPDGVKFIRKRFQIKKRRFSKFLFGMESQISDFLTRPSDLEESYTPFNHIYQNRKEYAI